MNKLDEFYCPIPGTDREEEIVIFTRKHWLAFLGQFILGVVIIIIPIIISLLIQFSHSIAIGGISRNFLVILMGIYYLVALTFIFTTWITFYYDIYILTKKEIIDITQRGFWERKISQLSLLRVQDVSSSIGGFLPTLFSYGDVLIETAGETENFLLESIPNPRNFSAKVLELHNQLIESSDREKQITNGEGFIKPVSIKKDDSTNQGDKKTLPPAPPPPPPPTSPTPPSSNKTTQGEVSQNDLKKGGEIKF